MESEAEAEAYRETLDVDGWIWIPIGARGYMIDVERRWPPEKFRVLVGNEATAVQETPLLRQRGFHACLMV
jgi:hypothetical protein